jgi:hypothetical protein
MSVAASTIPRVLLIDETRAVTPMTDAKIRPNPRANLMRELRDVFMGSPFSA